MSWWAVQAALTAALLVLPEVCDTVVTRLGIDEHRYRSVRSFRTPTSGWRRFEPGGTSRSRGRMSTIVDVTTGQVLGVVDGRDSAGVRAWLAARPTSWLDQVEVVAIVPREREVPPPSAAFRKALRTHLPCAAVSVDPFYADLRLAHGSWSLSWWMSSQHPSQPKATSPSLPGPASHLHVQPRRASQLGVLCHRVIITMVSVVEALR